MKKLTTSQRLKALMEARGLRQVDILEAARPYCEKYDVKLGKSDLSQYISGKFEPGQDKLAILGLALGVSEVWLMGYDVPTERSIAPDIAEDNERNAEFVELFNLLNDEQKTMIIYAIKGLLSEK